MDASRRSVGAIAKAMSQPLPQPDALPSSIQSLGVDAAAEDTDATVREPGMLSPCCLATAWCMRRIIACRCTRLCLLSSFQLHLSLANWNTEMQH